jgi:hypothetical protein
VKLAGTVTAMEGGCAPVPLGLRGTGGVREPYATWLFPLQFAVEYDEVPLACLPAWRRTAWCTWKTTRPGSSRPGMMPGSPG